MHTNKLPQISGVVLIADLFSTSDGLSIEKRRDLEQTEPSTLGAISDAIRANGYEVTHYQSPSELALNATAHVDDVVLSIYGGAISRNRMALVPAICESFGLRYIGPDVYGRIIAQDKEVSKRLAVDCGLLTPNWRVIREPGDLRYLTGVKYPCVVKPILEGSSIGITQRNIVHSFEEVAALSNLLITDFGQPVIVEDFVSGRETAYVAIASNDGIKWAYSEIVIDGDPRYFEHRLFDAIEKQDRTPGRTVRNIDSELMPEDRECIERYLRAYGKFSYCRVDGRHAEGRFHFLELTPDAWLGPVGQFAMAFTEKGWSYEEVIATILSSAA